MRKNFLQTNSTLKPCDTLSLRFFCVVARGNLRTTTSAKHSLRIITNTSSGIAPSVQSFAISSREYAWMLVIRCVMFLAWESRSRSGCCRSIWNSVSDALRLAFGSQFEVAVTRRKLHFNCRTRGARPLTVWPYSMYPHTVLAKSCCDLNFHYRQFQQPNSPYSRSIRSESRLRNLYFSDTGWLFGDIAHHRLKMICPLESTIFRMLSLNAVSLRNPPALIKDLPCTVYSHDSPESVNAWIEPSTSRRIFQFLHLSWYLNNSAKGLSVHNQELGTRVATRMIEFDYQ